jgi:hypothetical protein
MGTNSNASSNSRFLSLMMVFDTSISHLAWAMAPAIINLHHSLKKFI